MHDPVLPVTICKVICVVANALRFLVAIIVTRESEMPEYEATLALTHSAKVSDTALFELNVNTSVASV